MIEVKKVRKRRPLPYCVRLGCTIILALFLVFILLEVSTVVITSRPAWESRVRTTLRYYGEAQLGFRHYSRDGDWGTFEELVEAGYIVEGKTRDNIIGKYYLWTRVHNPTPVIDPPPYENTFTVVAFPRTTRPAGYLATFVIREDEVLRVYRPDPGVTMAWGEEGDYGAKTWEPIR